jgi:type II secretory ATPase GspE/PulE/Tfp pilus assembly ATPase PilB-like protein
MQTRGVYPAEMAPTVTSALKVMGNMDVAERRRPQEGSFTATFADRPVDFRVSSVGTSYGEKMVLRVLDRRLGLRRLQALGLRKSMYSDLHSIVTRQNGMLVVCGPTGSGKTTTLYAALQEVDRQALNVITIENPIEYSIENITQHDVNEAAGISFAKLLKTALHQDPDILMVGEMRDPQTAAIAIQAATTGHFVYTTAHAPDTVSGLFRLHTLGVQPYAVATALTAILAQRLMRRLCRSCRVAYKPTADAVKKLRLKEGQVLYAPKGCDKCHGTGWRGRIAAFELLVLDDRIRSLLQASASLSDIKEAARATGLVPLQADALAKAIAGITSVQEALRATT